MSYDSVLCFAVAVAHVCCELSIYGLGCNAVDPFGCYLFQRQTGEFRGFSAIEGFACGAA